tara:strand:+ start:700 stop:1086 length:387 start_codon:yes stop_codon:yes gene_type:complete
MGNMPVNSMDFGRFATLFGTESEGEIGMAKKSQIARNLKRQKTVARFAARRKALKDTIRNPATSDVERQEAYATLQSHPRDASPTRIKNRCQVSGRSRGYYRKFKVSRIALRELALQGLLPGVTKASW